MLVRVAHCACTDHTADAFVEQRLFKQLRRILFGFYIFKQINRIVSCTVLNYLITRTSRIAVDASVRAAPVDVHAVLSRKNSFSVYKMHRVLQSIFILSSSPAAAAPYEVFPAHTSARHSDRFRGGTAREEHPHQLCRLHTRSLQQTHA